MFWAYVDKNNNVIGLQRHNEPITVCDNGEDDDPPQKIEINGQLYMQLMAILF